MIPALKPEELPGDFADLAIALMEVRHVQGAALAVHDARLASRLVFLGLVDVSEKGLRGNVELERLHAELGPHGLALLMCTETPQASSIPTVVEPNSPECVAQLEDTLGVPPAQAMESNSSLPDAESRGTLHLEAEAGERLAPESQNAGLPAEVEPVEMPVFVLEQALSRQLETAQHLRETITALSRELQSILQPVTAELLLRSDLQELKVAVEQYPASLQRNNLLSRIAELELPASVRPVN